MSNRVETVDVVKSLVSLLEFTYIIDNIIDNGDGTYTLESCNTYHLHEFLIITIDALEYTIQSTVYNESITITGNPLPTATSFDIPAPFYFHGTVIKTNLELINLDQFDKMPMVYLLEVLEDDFLHRDEIIDRNSDLRLFFLTSANFTEWKTGDHYKNAIEPMRSLAYNFIDAVDSSKIIDTFAIYSMINRANFGVYVTDKGNESRIFNDNMSGVELRIPLPIKKDLTCINFCKQ